MAHSLEEKSNSVAPPASHHSRVVDATSISRFIRKDNQILKGRSKAGRRTATSSSSTSSEEEIVIRKGPWKAEEDEALLKHVNKYGPRDWSSLLSKGLLHRTGKSCRLRWVNKLRPNLKNGCKFSAEEERIVIELQAQLGNKWAKISTYLPGRTDNDVKNFWSSRQKRLARLLVNSQQQNPKSKPNKSNFPSLPSQAPNRDPLMIESSSKAESSSSLHYISGELEMVPLDTLIEPNNASLNPIPVDQHQQNLCFPEPPSDLQLLCPSAHEELIRTLDSDFLNVFPRADNLVTSGAIVGHDEGLMQLSSDMVDYLGPIQATGFSDQQLSGGIKVEAGNDLVLDENPLIPDRFFDDLPADIFDQMELLPNPPSDW